MARYSCFLPMYPFGHKVSETSSTGIVRGFFVVEVVVVVVVVVRVRRWRVP